MESSSAPTPHKTAASIVDRVAALDWARIARDLDAQGYATTGAVLRAAECAELIALYADRDRFRSRVVMERHRYGVGEYKYFARPMPPLVEDLRVAMYRELAATANRWAERMRSRDSYPASLDEFLKVCAAHGQTRPTPLILRYEQGGYNCLHQDLYGEVAFPCSSPARSAGADATSKAVNYCSSSSARERNRAAKRSHSTPVKE